jgi:hypothetical protein
MDSVRVLLTGGIKEQSVDLSRVPSVGEFIAVHTGVSEIVVRVVKVTHLPRPGNAHTAAKVEVAVQ